MSDLKDKIINYYSKRGLKWPDFGSAMEWVQTELAEVYELDLARKGGWVRNNPQDHPPYSKELMAEELGDAIFMLIVAGIAEGVDPIDAIEKKMQKKLELQGKLMTNSVSTIEGTILDVLYAEPDEKTAKFIGKCEFPKLQVMDKCTVVDELLDVTKHDDSSTFTPYSC